MGIRVKEIRKILIVDDSVEAADSFKDILELFGYQADCVYDGHQVLNLLLTGQFSIVFMDINLKDMSGITLLKNIKKSASIQQFKIKFIALSGYSVEDPIGVEASHAFDFYIQKPINLETLEILIASIDSSF